MFQQISTTIYYAVISIFLSTFSQDVFAAVTSEVSEPTSPMTSPRAEWVTPQTVSLIARFEGWIPNAYKCPADYWTIGYGHLITFDKECSVDEALQLFKEQVWDSDLSEGEKNKLVYELNATGKISSYSGLTLLKWDIASKADIRVAFSEKVLESLTPSQLSSLVSLTFNLGINAIRGSSVVRLLNEEKPQDVAADWISPWRKANGAVMLGLAKRRLAEVMIFMRRALDPNSGLLPSQQWGFEPMKYTDENWTMLKEADTKNGWGLLRDAVKIFEEYFALSSTA